MDIPDGDDADTNPGNETGYTITGRENGKSYTLRLRAWNAHGAGPWTPPITVLLMLAPGAPVPPGAPDRACGAFLWR